MSSTNKWYSGNPTVQLEIDRKLALDQTSDVSTFVPKTKTLNAQTGTTYTPVVADASKIVTLSNASAITLTLPKDATAAFPIGSSVEFIQIGAGLVTVAAESGATVHNSASATSLALKGQYAKITATKVAADTWNLNGEMHNT